MTHTRLAKIHLRCGTGPACMIVYTGKHFQMTNEPKDVTCARCKEADPKLISDRRINPKGVRGQ